MNKLLNKQDKQTTSSLSLMIDPCEREREMIHDMVGNDPSCKMEVTDLNLYYGDFHALKNVSIKFPEKQVTAMI